MQNYKTPGREDNKGENLHDFGYDDNLLGITQWSIKKGLMSRTMLKLKTPPLQKTVPREEDKFTDGEKIHAKDTFV